MLGGVVMGEFRSDSLRLVSLLIGQGGFEDLLIMLPDEFFGLDAEGKAWVWDQLLGEVNQGVIDPARLAKAAMALVEGR
jgi:hypothetical protein